MRILKNYLNFINEGFDLQNSYKKNHIPDVIQEYANNIVSGMFHSIKKIPIDVKQDKLTFLFARNIYNFVYTEITKTLNYYYDQYSNPANDKNYIDIEHNKYKDCLNYLKGKPINTKLVTISEIIKSDFTKFDNYYSKIETNVIDYIFSSIRNINVWKLNYSATLEEIANLSKEWHDNLKASGSITSEDGVIITEYPDGFYWIDLQNNDCSEEADAMGHCGRSGSDTLLSLRQKKQNGNIEPFVTIAINYSDDVPTVYSGNAGGNLIDYEKINFNNKIYSDILQCKGKNNKKPMPKYHRYIIDLYLKYNIGDKLGREYQPEYDFEISDLQDETLIRKVLDKKPDLVKINDILFYENHNFTKIILEEFPNIVNTTKLMSNNYYLMDKQIITKEEFVNKYKNAVILEDDKIYLKIYGNFTNLSFMYDDNDGGRNYSSKSLVENIEEYNDYNDVLDFDTILTRILTKKSIREIEDKIEKIKLTLDKDELEEFEEYDDWEEQVKNIDALSDLKDAIEIAFNEAQNLADENEESSDIFKPAFDFFGIEKFKYFDGGLLFELDKKWIIRYDKYNGPNYGNKKIGNIILEDYFKNQGYDEDIEPEVELLKINTPNYGWGGSGTIDPTILEDCITDKLSEI